MVLWDWFYISPSTSRLEAGVRGKHQISNAGRFPTMKIDPRALAQGCTENNLWIISKIYQLDESKRLSGS